MVLVKVDEHNKELHYDDNLVRNLERVKDSVMNKGWDHACIIAGIPGAGKSTLGQQLCKYFDSGFSINNICFTAKEFIDKTSNGKKGQAFMLDESFADMNSNLSRNPEFIALMNHIQLIRIKGLFIVLVLPDFFSLNRNLAVFRTSFLFVVYAEDYKRGAVAIFDRKTKARLYKIGKPFIDYQAVKPNFRCRFTSRWLVNYEEYEKKKLEHLRKGVEIGEKTSKATIIRNKLAIILCKEFKLLQKEVAKKVDVDEGQVSRWVTKAEEWYNAGYKG